MMRLLITQLLVLFILLQCALAAEPPGGSRTKSGLRLPEYRTVRLENGTTLLLMERHQLPLVSFRWLMRSAGSIHDPEGKEGVAMLTAQLLRKGSQTKSAAKISEAIDFVGGSMDAGVSHDAASGSAEFVKKDVPLAIDLLTELLLSPSFPADEVEKMVLQEIDGIKEEKAVPGQVIGRYYAGFLYGSHPYGRPAGGTELSLAHVTRNDVEEFYRNHYLPSQLILAVAGDFAAPEIEKMLRDKFSSWKASDAKWPELKPPQHVQGRRVLLVEKPDATQTFFRLGNIGLARTNSDWVATQVVNTLFGGRFTSMINSELRIQSGLTYHAGSSFEARQVPGAFAIAAYTQNEATERALDMTLSVLKRLHKEGITAQQLQSAKTYIKGQFGPTLQTDDELAQTISELEFYGLGADYINNYFQHVDAVSLEDARRIIDKYYPLEDLAFVVIGQRAVIEPVAKKLAEKITKRSITDPGF